MAEEKTPWELASEWFARTIAIVVVMIAPGVLGAWLDKRLGTSLIAIFGFVIGMLIATGMLLLYTRIKPNEKSAHRVGTPAKSPLTDIDAKPESATSRDTLKAPSQASLPELPGAEILEPRSHDARD